MANISRVQTLRLIPRGKSATFYPLREITVLLLLAGATVVALPRLHLKAGFNVQHDARLFATGVVVLAGIRIAYLLCLLIYRLLIRRPHYALVIEAAGTQYTALYGNDHGEIQRIRDVIVAGIENPPSIEQPVNVKMSSSTRAGHRARWWVTTTLIPVSSVGAGTKGARIKIFLAAY